MNKYLEKIAGKLMPGIKKMVKKDIADNLGHFNDLVLSGQMTKERALRAAAKYKSVSIGGRIVAKESKATNTGRIGGLVGRVMSSHAMNVAKAYK